MKGANPPRRKLVTYSNASPAPRQVEALYTRNLRVIPVRPQAARRPRRNSGMKTLKFTYWRDGNYYLGFLNDYPDYETQATSKEELVANLKSLLGDIESGDVPYIRKVEELVVSE